jgi:predicted PurR-regulated permease PerM
MKDNKYTVEVSPKTVAITIAMIIGLVVAWIIKPVIFMFFIAFIVSSAFKPFVNYLEKYKIPRIVSSIVIFTLFSIVVLLGFVTIINQTFIQLKALIEQIPNIAYSIASSASNLFPILSQYVDPDLIKSTLKDSVGGLLNVGQSLLSTGVVGVFDVVNTTVSSVVAVIMVVIMAVYLLVRKENVYDGMLLLINKKKRKDYIELLSKIEVKLGEWLRTELFIMLLIGLIVWAGIMLPGLFVQNYNLSDYALPIAFIAMILEIIPGTGVVVAGFIAALIAIGSNQPYIAIYIAVLFVFVQQIETSVLIPNIMSKVVGVDPILSITGFLAFYILFGPIGAVLVVPLMIVIQLVLDFGVDGVIDGK